jgi:branched-chain amino acid transport system substrate-binding protein
MSHGSTNGIQREKPTSGRSQREEIMRASAFLKFAALCAAGLLPVGASAQDAYTVGVTAAMTGPASATQAPVIEMLRIYIDRINAKGGINGHKINLLIEDDQAEPSKAAANATKLVRQENVMLLINSSFSSTYGPVIAEAKRGKVPLWFAGAVCPKETHPPKPDPLLFCTTGFDFSIDIPVATKVIKETSKEPAKLGLIGIPVPISRIGVDTAEKIAASLGMETVDKEFIPPTTADYTPFANKIKSAGANWGYAYAPWPAEAKTFEALRRLGWTGSFMAYGHIQAEDELARIADQGLNVFMANSMFLEGGAVFQEIRDAAAAGKYSFPATYGT